MKLHFIPISFLILLFSTASFSQDTTQTSHSQESSVLQTYKNEVGLAFNTNSYSSSIGLSYHRYMGKQQKIASYFNLGTNFKDAISTKTGVLWYLKPKARSLTIGLAVDFLYSKYSYTEHDFSKRTIFLGISGEVGYTFIIKERLTIYPSFNYSPLMYIYHKEDGYNNGSQFNQSDSFSTGYSYGYLGFGIKLGYRF